MSKPVTASEVVIHGISVDEPIRGRDAEPRSGMLNLVLRDIGSIEKRLRESGHDGRSHRLVLWAETDNDSGVIANLADAYEALRKERDGLVAEVATLKEKMRIARAAVQDAGRDLDLGEG